MCDVVWKTKTLVWSQVLLFSKLYHTFFGYFDPANVALDNENKHIFGVT